MWWLLALVVVFAMSTSLTAIAYVRGTPTKIELAPLGEGHFLRVDAAQTWLDMAAAARADGVTLAPERGRSCFRTMEEQQALVAELGTASSGGLAATAGYSPHQEGIAVDVDLDKPGAFDWLTRNAARWHWRRSSTATGQREPWHWEHRP